MMIKKQLSALTIFFLLTTLAVGFFFQENYALISQRVLYESDYLFYDAVKRDYQRRSKDHYYSYSFPIENDWPKKEIRVTTEKGTRVQTNIDSIRRLPLEEKVRLLGESYLLEVNPINPDTLNMTFQNLLCERKIKADTEVSYTDIEKNKTYWSGKDTTFFTSAHLLKEYNIGLFNEMKVCSYIKVPFLTIIERLGIRFFIPVAIWLSLFCVYVIYNYRIWKQRQTQKNRSKADYIKQMLKLERETCLLHYKDQCVKLPPNLFQLIALFLNSPNCFLTKEDIVNELWKGMENPSNRISQTICRLRTILTAIPEIKIESISRLGYQLNIHDLKIPDKA